MLASNFKEGQAGHNVTLDMIPSNVLEKILPYFYGADVEISHDDLLDVLKVADMWMLDKLKLACVDELPKIINQENVAQIRDIVLVYNLNPEIFVGFEQPMYEKLDSCWRPDEEFLKISHDLLQRYFVEYQCPIKDENDVLLAIYYWWKNDKEKRTKHIQGLLSRCVRHDEVDKSSFSQRIARLQAPNTDYNEFMSYITRCKANILPPARCGSMNSPDGMLLASIRKRELYFVRIKIEGTNDSLVFGEAVKATDSVQNIVLSGNDSGMYMISKRDFTKRPFPPPDWYVYNLRTNREEKSNDLSGLQVIRKEGSHGCYVAFKDILFKYLDIKTFTTCNGKIEWTVDYKGGPFKNYGTREDEDMDGEVYLAWSDYIVGIYHFFDKETHVRIFDLKEMKPAKSFAVADDKYNVIDAVAQKNEYVLFVAGKCYLFSILQAIQLGRGAIVEFPLYDDYDECMSACIVGHILVISEDGNGGIKFFACDLNKVLAHAEQHKNITSSIWREMKIPDSIAKAEWMDCVYLMQEKFHENYPFFPDGHITHTSPRDIEAEN